MEVLLTGASGFLGKHILASTEFTDSSIRAVYRFGSKSEEHLNRYFVDNIDAHTNWLPALKNIDCVIHCAARVHVMSDTKSDPLNAYRQVNTEGTVNLAEQAMRCGVKRFIFISTIKVNGEETGVTPYKASDIANPSDPYGISKYEAEQALLELARRSTMEVVIIRPPLIYGPGVKANFAALAKIVNKGFPLPFGSVIKNKRSMVGITNLVSLIKECTTNKKAANQVFLVSDEVDLSTADFVTNIARALEKKTRLFPVPPWLFKLLGVITGKGQVVSRICGSLQVDIEHTKQTLDWKPVQSVEEGFKEALSKFK
ncbi:SDR family oxidoreductase [Thalassotalea litorea]|uniref:SDR family oxidoreductase n=1 Tax=Thalassotalea litorea TaxID=2020715 RepID=A0A5R9IHT2_9GAMM|nr:SDR family oxidoreductase [Thalassotalea litorea]TLU65100.1 SDR family oxidoreductase [Thalassotalea litorea]